MEYAVLVSGGVDSAVALHKAKQHCDVHGGTIRAYYLQIWLEDELSFLGSCPWEEDIAYARQVCRRVGVPLEVLPMQDAYYEQVVSYTVKELREGRTPSPDLLCNQRIKFGVFADAVHADVVASGHYAQLERKHGKTLLRRAADTYKDQTYFLSYLSQKQLSRLLFPLGTMNKADVRQEAAALGFDNHDRADSQGICFLGKIPYQDFVRHYLGEQAGQIREAKTGRILGAHKGAWFYTIGQRRGLRLNDGPWYVSGRNIQENIVWVSHGTNMQFRQSFFVSAPNWLADPPHFSADSPAQLQVKIRHCPEFTACTVQQCSFQGISEGMNEGVSENAMIVNLETLDAGIAAGQFAVFYDGKYCLGCAPITE